MRLERISNTTKTVIAFLIQHPLVEEVLFPLSPSFSQYQLAKQQMTGACGLLTFTIRATTVQQIETFCESLQHILMAVSWGGYESLIMPKCAGLPHASFNTKDKSHRMLRLYVGLEDADYIIKDLEQAFKIITT
jgi:cystathionine beta-lyase/cystathionine gamma-synthase